jgi:phosphopantothenoylcysteine decarboxylase/phosphopantothenate--cysteine ligase
MIPVRSPKGGRNDKASNGMKRPAILIAAGPTRERIDPVRFISNYSTGTFGYELAREALRRGARVTLVSGPTYLKAPAGTKLIGVESALDMREAILSELKRADYVIMSAAVSDWRPNRVSRCKIKRAGGEITLKLVENPDILSEICERKANRVVAGFALETENLEKNALKKMLDKNADIIVANCLKKRSAAFGDGKVDIVIMDRFGNKTEVRNRSKEDLSKIILDKVFSFTPLEA